jgi:hypothetical protein
VNKTRFEAFSDGVFVAYRVGWVTYAVATLTSLVAPILSLVLYVLIVGYYLVPRGADTDLAQGP